MSLAHVLLPEIRIPPDEKKMRSPKGEGSREEGAVGAASFRS